MNQQNTPMQVFLFGDTQHANPAIKREIAKELPALRAQGYTVLAIEVDHSKQALVDALVKNADPDIDMVAYARDTLKTRNAEGIGALLSAAITQGMHVACIDDKSGSEAIDKRYPEFKATRQAFNAMYHEVGDEAEQASLAAMRDNHTEEFERYLAAYAQWKVERADTDQPMADALELLARRGEKVVAVLGQSHLTRTDGVPYLLEKQGVIVTHMDVYQDRVAYDAFEHRSFEAGESKNPPQYARFIDEGLTVAMRLDAPIIAMENDRPTSRVVQMAQHTQLSHDKPLLFDMQKAL